ncbi:DUF7694 domain-containing protein [Bradyrhizobium stylosanthis]|uniref:DUF7694 domain-containing protein n=1 Tax=Bradyrhizobium stylosanthis TaxID=1803665 RepID=UPI0011A4651F
MRAQIGDQLEGGRVRYGQFASAPGSGPCGLFIVQGPCGCELKIISLLHPHWEHVSVSIPRRCPNWQEMCFVKDLFWDGEECVMQLHPPRSEYVNNNRYCLHLWRPTCQEIPTPPSWLVGIVGIGPSEAASLAAQIGGG